MLGIQPVLGILHHLQYRRRGSRGIFGYVHIWYGRALIILGMVNGGLGLQLAGGSNIYIIVYSVAAGISALAYTAYTVVKLLMNQENK